MCCQTDWLMLTTAKSLSCSTITGGKCIGFHFFLFGYTHISACKSSFGGTCLFNFLNFPFVWGQDSSLNFPACTACTKGRYLEALKMVLKSDLLECCGEFPSLERKSCSYHTDSHNHEVGRSLIKPLSPTPRSVEE